MDRFCKREFTAAHWSCDLCNTMLHDDNIYKLLLIDGDKDAVTRRTICSACGSAIARGWAGT